MFSKIQFKLIVLISLVIFVLLMGVLLVITQTVETQIVEKIRSDFKKSQATFEVIQKLNYDRLVETSLILSDQPVLKETISLLNDPKNKLADVSNTVAVTISDLANSVKADLILVTDNNGVLLSSLTQPGIYGDSLASHSFIQKSLSGADPEVSPEFITLWYRDNFLFQVVSVPAFTDNFQSVVGTLTLGTIIGQREADTLKYITGFDVTFVLDSMIIASTLRKGDQFLMIDQIMKNKGWIETVDSTMKSTPVFDLPLTADKFFNVLAPVGKGAHAFYVLSSPYNTQLTVIRNIQTVIYYTGGISLLLAILVTIFLGTSITRPIKALSAGVERIKSGNYDVSIDVNTKDELGLLTTAFNEMAKGLKERFHLLRYVGSHTKEMIGLSDSTEANFAGQRVEATVLFSDIRGFTAYSEKITPEEVIGMLNQYLSIQAELVEKYRGSVDKFVGDEMVAIFLNDDQEARASFCATEILRKTREMNLNNEKPIGIGIGINTGQVVLGNMGSQNRLDYTVIGANVNLGARLCSAAKAGQILMTESTAGKLPSSISVNPLEPMNFKGFSKAIQIFEVKV
ncbi:MAG: HAMP domain-containing protein [Bacteroidetes bacterium]|nr:HAMP domain-containing protein [Bacteroidota bacterium]